mmetsp:Transcript_87668/g.252826  ORF Transcript_87668/g.252826 Transcript_87668/m.252826 type:complete len:279 (+) Transcript_87668:521-1357(+)
MWVRIDHRLAQRSGFFRHALAAKAHGAQQTALLEVQGALHQLDHVNCTARQGEGVAPSEHQHVHGHARRPNVHCHAVARAVCRQLVLLGRHVCECATLLREQPEEWALGRHAHVSKLQCGSVRRVGDQEVVRLDIAMANLLAVQIFDGRQHLVDPEDNFRLAHLHAALSDLVVKITTFAIFEGQVNEIGVFIRLIQLDDVLVRKGGEQSHLIVHVRSLNAKSREHALVELLDRNNLARLSMSSAPNDAERALAEFDLLQVVCLLDRRVHDVSHTVIAI